MKIVQILFTIIIIGCFASACVKKHTRKDYVTYSFSGRAFDWYNKTPLAGVKIKIYAVYYPGGLSHGSSELVGEVMTNSEGKYVIYPEKSTVFDYQYSDYTKFMYRLVAEQNVGGYYTNTFSKEIPYSRFNPEFTGTIDVDFKYGQKTILKINLQGNSSTNNATQLSIGSRSENTDIGAMSNELLSSSPLGINGLPTSLFEQKVDNGFVIFEVLANDTNYIGNGTMLPPNDWDYKPTISIYCPAGDTTYYNYVY